MTGEWGDVAEFTGIGCTYAVQIDLSGSRHPYSYRLVLTSGPIERVQAEGLSWVAVCDLARDAIAEQIEAEGGASGREPVSDPDANIDSSSTEPQGETP